MIPLWLPAGLTLVAAGAGAGEAGAAVQEAPADSLRLEGLLRIDGEPADSGTVTLHRVSAQEAGPVDSTSVDGEGRFTLILPTEPGSPEPEGDPPEAGEGSEDLREGGHVYFASAHHESVLYHGAPLADPEHLEEEYVIDGYSAVAVEPDGAELRLVRREILLEEIEGAWAVTDLFELENPHDRTYVPGDEGAAVWSHSLPPGADRFEVGEGDLPASRAVAVEGEVRVTAPMTPGRRPLVFRYELPDLERELPLEARADSVELYIRDPAPSLTVSGLDAVQPVEVEPGTSFRRYAGAAVGPGALTFEEEGDADPLPAERLVVLLTLVLAVAGVWAALRARRGRVPATAHAGAAGQPAAASVLEEVAALDEAHARGEGPPGPEYRERRRELLERLRGEP